MKLKTMKLQIVGLSASLLISNSTAHAIGAEQAALGAAGGAMVAVGVSAMVGHSAMKIGCNQPWGMALCIAGAGLIVEAVMKTAPQSSNYANTGAAINNGDGSTDTSSAGAGSGGAGTDPGSTSAPLPPGVQEAVNAGNALAAQQGTTLQGLASRGGGGDSGGGSGLNMDGIPPEAQAAIKAAIKDAQSKFHISSVATEDNTGGGRKSANTGGGLDLNALINGMKNNRAPASVAGLSKTVNGEPIGVAGDNIFQQITRKYKNKIAAQTFLAPQQKAPLHN